MTLLECIDKIPSCLNKVVENYQINKKILLNYLKDNDIEEIVFVASGTSFNAAKVTRYFVNDFCKLKSNFFYPNDFVNYYNYFNEKALYVFVSQGGNTKLVYEALLKIKNKGLLNCSITESLDSMIAKSADVCLKMESDNEEYLYRTIGYSTTVLNCWLIEMIISIKNQTREDEFLKEITNAITNIENIKEKTKLWYQKNKNIFLDKEKIILTGAKDFFEVANEADIKFMEMVPIFTRSFELEELIHGPQNAFDKNTLYFVLTNKNFDKNKFISIGKFLKNEIGDCVLVGDEILDEKDLCFNFSSKNFTAIEEITAFQVLAYYFAIARKRDLKIGINTSIKNYVNKMIEKEKI